MTLSHRQTPSRSAAHAAVLLLVGSLAACSSLDNLIGGEKIDYRSTGTKTPGLEVPPDLTQLARETRYQQPQGGTVSAAAFQSGAPATAVPVTTSVAPAVLGATRIEREGTMRWLATPIPPDQLWPQLQGFWRDRGLTLSMDQSDIGVMETEWAENRAKLPNDIIRNTIGKVFDSLYSTGERDKYRTRVERTASGGSDVYITHRGMAEVYTNATQKDSTVWEPRPSDPALESEMLQRLLVKLGMKDEEAKTAVAASTTTGSTVAARARAVNGQAAATLQVDDSFDRAWRRVGLALDRSGFTVEDRDRTQGLYFVRYVDPANAGKDEPNFIMKLFTKSDNTGPVRYRVLVKGDGERSTISVLDTQGAPENGEAGKRIVRLLIEDLK